MLSSLASEYRLAINYAIEVLSEIEAVLEADERPVLRALVASMKSDLEAHIALALLLEEAGRSPETEENKKSIALPEPPEETTEPVPEEIMLYAEET